MCIWQKLKLFEKSIKSGYLFKIPFASRSLWPRKFLEKFENMMSQLKFGIYSKFFLHIQ